MPAIPCAQPPLKAPIGWADVDGKRVAIYPDERVWGAWFRDIRNILETIEGTTIGDLAPGSLTAAQKTDLTDGGGTTLHTHDHNSGTTGHQGGAAAERYHLTQAQHTDLTDGGNATVHTHDHNTGVTGQQGGAANDYYHLTQVQHTDLTDGGLTTLHRHAADYGSMYADNVTQTITIGAANTWLDIDAGLTGGESNAFTFQNASELKCNIAGKYLAVYSISAETTAVNENIEGAVGVNSTEQLNTTSHTFVPLNSNEFLLAGTGIITLAVDDIVTLMLNNNTGADDIVLEHANLTLWKVND